MIFAYRKKSNLALVVMLVSFFGALVCNKLNDPFQPALQWGVALLATTSGLAFWCAVWFYIKAKGRSGWWLLMMVFSFFGLLALLLLEDRAKGDLSEDGLSQADTHRKWGAIAKLNNLNGWQRLWVFLALLWIVPVGIYAYRQWPSLYDNPARIAGCVWRGEWFSMAAPGIVNEELTNWRRELPPKLTITWEQATRQPELARRAREIEFIPEYEVSGYLPRFPEWKGDPIGRPEWAHEPWVKAYCKTLFERLEQSGRADQLRTGSSEAILKPRIIWLVLITALWIVPAVGVYVLGLAIFWVRRGFQKRP